MLERLGSNSVYFKSITKEDLIIIDMGEKAFSNLLNKGMLESRPGNIFVLLTNFHPSKVSTLFELIDYYRTKFGKSIKIVYPQEIALSKLLSSYAGVAVQAYDPVKLMHGECCISLSGSSNSLRDAQLIGVEAIEVPFPIPCFAYVIRANNQTVYYSGHSAAIPEEVLNRFVNNEIDVIYQDTMSSNTFDSTHMSIEKLSEVIPRDLRSRVFCINYDVLDKRNIKRLGFKVL